jgi:FAD/FMN-containing dehydrogenase
MTTAELSPSEFHAFAAALTGRVIRPDDPEYDAARRVWNGSVDRYPSLVVRPRSNDDVARSILAARAHGLDIAVRGGGHNVAGSGTCDTGLVLDLVDMDDVSVDPDLGTVRAGGGCRWAQVDAAAGVFGLATPGGQISSTGVGGLTLGGGIGWLSRKHGYSCDNLLEVELVVADGRTVRASEEENGDLFWALRGGGGNFGVATSFTFRGRPVATVLGGPMFFDTDRSSEVLAAYAAWAPTLPDEMSSMLAFLTAPPEPFVPPTLRGRPAMAILVCHAGGLAEGVALLDRLRDRCPPDVDVVGPLPYPALQGMLDKGAPHGIRSYWKSGYLSKLGPGVQEALLGVGDMPTPQCQVHVQQLGGAVAAGSSGAVGHRDAAYVVNILGNGTSPDDEPAVADWVRATWARLEPLTAGAYLNFLDGDDATRVRSAFAPEAWDRLVAVKTAWDPDNVFHINHNIPPSQE